MNMYDQIKTALLKELFETLTNSVSNAKNADSLSAAVRDAIDKYEATHKVIAYLEELDEIISIREDYDSSLSQEELEQYLSDVLHGLKNI